MRCQTSERSDDVSPLSNGRLCAGACEKNPRTFAHSVGLFIKIILTSLVCLCIDVCPSNPTKAQPISTPRASVEALYLHLHSPLLASETVLSSWSLVVIIICTLITREKFQPELELQAGTTWYLALHTRAQYICCLLYTSDAADE